MGYKFISKHRDINTDKWNQLLDHSAFGSVFQNPNMYQFWQSQAGYTPYAYGVYCNDELLAVCLVVVQSNGRGVKHFFSRRAIIYGGPIINTDHEDKENVLDYLLTGMNEALRKVSIYSEFRNAFSFKEFDHVFRKHNYDYIPYQNFKIALTDEDTIFSGFKSEKRRQIRRSLKEGVEISYENSDANIQGVYEIIEDIYLNKVKKPLPKLKFFAALANQELGNVIALYYKGKVIGGGFLVYDDRCVYDWYRGGMDREYKHQYPSTLAAWAVIKFGLDNELKEFDFMGAGIKGEEYGVRKFKAQFGGRLVEHGRYRQIYKTRLYNLAKRGLNTINKFR